MAARAHSLHLEGGGAGPPLLLLLHGLSATAAVWSRFITHVEQNWRGRWIAPDLPGHGASGRLVRYGLKDYATALAPIIREEREVWIIGHSLGGAIALELASNAFALPVAGAYGIGIKTSWDDGELSRLAAISERQPRAFTQRPAAEAYHAQASGLAGSAAAPVNLTRGVTCTEAGWCVAMDMRAYAIEPPPMEKLVEAARCEIHLARGEMDPMVTLDQLRSYDPQAKDIPAAGHNVMIDQPAAVWNWFDQCR